MIIHNPLLFVLYFTLFFAFINPSFGSAPAAPTTLTLAATAIDSELTLNWNVGVGGGTLNSYTIYCNTAPDCPLPITELASSTTSQTITGLTNGNIYDFTISAIGTDPYLSANATISATPSCGSGVLEFSTSSISIVESNVVTLTVTRTQGTAGFVQVRVDTLVPAQTYTNPDGITRTSRTTGLPNYDFSPLVNNLLIFASGVSTQTLQFATLEDTLFETNEFVDIHLSAPSGGLGACRAVIGSQSPIQVTIIDNGDASVAFTSNEFRGLEGESIQVNATLQSLTDLTSPAYNITEIGVFYRRVGLPDSDAGGNAIYDVDFRASSTNGELTFHGAHTPIEWLADNRTFDIATLQDTLGEDNENILVQLYDPICYCTLSRQEECRDTTMVYDHVNNPVRRKFFIFSPSLCKSIVIFSYPTGD